MNRNQHWDLSSETLNALVDNEYPAAEKAELMQMLLDDEAASAELCRLQRVKEMVKTAYEQPPVPQPKQGRETSSKRNRVVAAVSMLLVGVMAFFLPGLFNQPATERFVLLDPDGRGAHPAVAEDQEVRIVFHVASTTRARGEDLLGEIQALLEDYRSRGEKLRVEVVANGEGLDLLREKLSTQKQKLSELAQQYPNLTFVACLNTVKRLRVEQGVIVKLVPEAETTASGVAYVVKRQQEGWIYIQV